MANLISTTSGTLSATTITSPKMLLSNAYTATNEYTGYTAINNGESVDLICNTQGYMRMIGLCNFFMYTSGSWYYGVFEFDISRYGVQHTNILHWGGYSISHYQEADLNRNWLRFTNTSGTNSSQTHFNLRVTNVTSYESSILTRIK